MAYDLSAGSLTTKGSEWLSKNAPCARWIATLGAVVVINNDIVSGKREDSAGRWQQIYFESSACVCVRADHGPLLVDVSGTAGQAAQEGRRGCARPGGCVTAGQAAQQTSPNARLKQTPFSFPFPGAPMTAHWIDITADERLVTFRCRPLAAGWGSLLQEIWGVNEHIAARWPTSTRAGRPCGAGARPVLGGWRWSRPGLRLQPQRGPPLPGTRRRLQQWPTAAASACCRASAASRSPWKDAGLLSAARWPSARRPSPSRRGGVLLRRRHRRPSRARPAPRHAPSCSTTRRSIR